MGNIDSGNTGFSATDEATALKRQRRRILVKAGVALFFSMFLGVFIFGTVESTKASASAPSEWQASLASVGIKTDADTAERVRRHCVDGFITFDMIADYQGSKQLVTVQCGYNGVTDAIVRYPRS